MRRGGGWGPCMYGALNARHWLIVPQQQCMHIVQMTHDVLKVCLVVPPTQCVCTLVCLYIVVLELVA